MPTDIEVNGQLVSSGIFKSPVDGPVELGLTNLSGDGQANLKFHGGREKAVYVYSANYYPHWQNALQRDKLDSQLISETHVKKLFHVLGSLKEKATIQHAAKSDVICYLQSMVCFGPGK